MTTFTIRGTDPSAEVRIDTGPAISSRDWLNDWNDHWTEAAVCTLNADLDDPDGGWAGRFLHHRENYSRLSERIANGANWRAQHGEDHPSWEKNDQLYNRLWWLRERQWERMCGASRELHIQVWALWVCWEHMEREERFMTIFDDVEISPPENPQDIWREILSDFEPPETWPPPEGGWRNTFTNGWENEYAE